jgi:hypothetical protein
LWLQTLTRCLGLVLFAHPLYWWFRARLRENQEIRADAAAAGVVGRIDYAAALVSWARLSNGRHPLEATLSLWEKPCQLKRRVAMLLNGNVQVELHSPGHWRWGTWAIMGIGIFALSLASLRPLTAETGETPELAPGPDVASPVEPAGVPEMAGRSGPAKVALLKDGSSAKAEAAVASGLDWLVKHQAADGHWSLDHFENDAKCNCEGGATREDAIAGTAFGLLPLLGAGQTHQLNKPGAKVEQGKAVERGLQFLIKGQQNDGGFTNFLYSHALASLAVCEAFGMTADPALKNQAQKAIDYIVKGQATSGGWSYAPGGTRSDTSVTGFQVVALKSGQMAGLQVPAATWQSVSKWLDSCAAPDGSGYGYTGPQATPSMTAVGLLCRLYLGNSPRDPAFRRGIEKMQLVRRPDPYADNIYYYYYATQVLHHIGGEAWEKWNPAMRDALIARQDRGTEPGHAHQKGSWSSQGDAFGAQGGRLMTTSWSLLTLEVYYRHLPLYRRDLGTKKAP